MTISRAQMPRQLYEVGSTPPSMEKMIQAIMEMTGVSREEAIRIIQTMENPQETMDDATMIQEGYQLKPRQKYGLGSIVKSITKGVKSVAKGVGDIVSSDAGKLALLAAGGYYLGGLGGATGFGRFAPSAMGKGLASILPGAGQINFLGEYAGGPTSSIANFLSGRTVDGFLSTSAGKAAAGIGGASLLAGIFGTEEQAQELYSTDPAEFNAKVEQYVKNLNPGKKEEVLKQIQSDIAKLGDVSQAEQIFTRNIAAEGGIMDIPTGEMRQNSEGVIERDYRDEGGFVPVGIKEKADDVPAMLSKNEFVMTADAVRGAGNGSIEKGAQIMYDNMKRLESRIA